MKKLFILTLSCVGLSLSVYGQKTWVATSGIHVSDSGCHTVTLSWMPGNGDGRLVIIGEQTNTTLPGNGFFYTPNTTYGNGYKLGSSYSIYVNTGNQVTVDGLKSNTTYHVYAYEYDKTSNYYTYTWKPGYTSFTTSSISGTFSLHKSYQCLSGNEFKFSTDIPNQNWGKFSYAWHFGDGSPLDTNANPMHSYSKGGIYKVTATATGSKCSFEGTLYDTVVTPYITDFMLDTSIHGPDPVFCAGYNELLFKNLSTPPSSPIYGPWDRSRYAWSTDWGHKGSTRDYNLKMDRSGWVTVILEMSRQVAKGGEFCSDTVEHKFYILPPILDRGNVTINDSVQKLSGNSFEFEHFGALVTSTWWYFGDGDSSSQNPVSHTYDSIGNYDVICRVQDSAGCQQDFSFTVEVTKDVHVHNLTSVSTQIYPNPVTDIIRWNSDHPYSVFEVFDVFGKLVWRGTLDDQYIDLGDFKSGVYVLRLDNQLVYRFMKE